MIGEDIIVEVVELGTGRVRLGFHCPKNIKIYRQELLPARPREEKPDANGQSTGR